MMMDLIDSKGDVFILSGSEITIQQGAELHLDGADSVLVQRDAKLTNLGTLSSIPIDNQGSVESVCTSQLNVIEGTNPISYLHRWGDWIQEIEPSIGAKGLERRTCQDNPEHQQTRSISALVMADYTDVIEAIKLTTLLNPEDYVNYSAVAEAVDSVVTGLDSSRQTEVDAMAKAIRDAIAALQLATEEVPDPTPEGADYSGVLDAIQAAIALNASDYVDFSGVRDAVNSVVLGLSADKQDEVDRMEQAILDAIDALEPVRTGPNVPIIPDDDEWFPVYPGGGGGSADDDITNINPNYPNTGGLTDEELSVLLMTLAIICALFAIFLLILAKKRKDDDEDERS